MATFHIGQRAKMVNCENAPNPAWRNCNGDEVTILGLPGCVACWPTSYRISRPAHCEQSVMEFYANSAFLVPLTDPGAERFLESIRRLGREPQGAPLPQPLARIEK